MQINFLPSEAAPVSLPEPAQKTSHDHMPRAPRRRWRRAFFVIGVLGLLTTLVLTLYGLGLMISGAMTVRVAMSHGQAAMDEADFAAAEAALEEAADGLANMRQAFVFLSYLQPLPWVGEQLSGAKSAVDAASQTVAVLLSGVRIGEDIFASLSGAGSLLGATNEARPYGELTADEKRVLLSSLAGSLSKLQEMQVRLRLAQNDLDHLAELHLTPALDTAIAPLRELIPELLASIDVLVPFAAIAPEYAGLNDPRQFLVLFLNNDELRPGGGFIGVFGLMTIKDGDIASLITADSYAVDALVQNTDYHVNPPPPIVSFLGQPVWWFRDAAWSPDFSQTAKDATQLLRQEVAWSGQPVPEIHGVVGITPTFISSLLSLVGPITVEGQTFTSDNVADLLEYQVEVAFAENGIPLEQRKEIVSLLTDQLVDRLLALPPSSWPQIFTLIHQAFDEKTFALMSSEPKTQAALADYGWGGVPNPAQADDVLMLIDANLASLKTDRVIERDVTYAVKPQGSGYRATATIAYSHRGGFDWKTTRYRTYARLYVPAGSTLVAVSGNLQDDKTRNPTLAPGTVAVADELGMTSFGAFIAIEPGQKGTLTFVYDLPASVSAAVARGNYSLQAIKQMGGGDNSLTLDLNFGNTVASAVPPESSEEFYDDSYRVTTKLSTDKLFTVRLR